MAIAQISDMLEFLYNSLPGCYYICKRLLRDDSTAEKVCISVYKKVINSPEKVPDNTNLDVWMRNVAAVACSGLLRKNNPEIFVNNTELTAISKTEVSNGDSLNMATTAKYVENCIDRMPLPVAFAAICYYYNGMTVAQIAKIMDLLVVNVKELLRTAADSLSALTREFNDKQVTTTKIDIPALLDVCAASLALPSIDLEALLSKPEIEEETEELAEPPKRKKSRLKIFLFILIPLVVCAIALAVAYVIFGLPENGKEADSTPETVVSEYTESIPEDTLDQVEVEPTTKPVKGAKKATPPSFVITKEIHYDSEGERIREAAYLYTEGVLKRVQTATYMFTEELNYEWNAEGTKRTTTDADGNVIETAWFDANGNPTKLKFNVEEDNLIKYKWSYKLNEQGYISKATYKAATAGSYSYTYDENGRILTETHTTGGDKYSTAYTYDDKGMIISKVETDFDGTILETYYTYDYEGYTFAAEVSDGTKIEGKFAPNLAQ